MTTDMYDAQASSIIIEDITTDESNRMILKRMRRNKNTHIYTLYIQNQHQNEEDCNEYVPEGANDMGWLGYFIGKSNDLKDLYISDVDTSNIDVKPFFSGVSSNKSIRRLEFYNMDLLDGEIFTMLDQFFKNNISLEVLTINGCNLEEDGCWRLLALAIGNCNSLTDLTLMNNTISDEGLVDIITALSIHPRLQHLDLEDNCLQKNGCIALATLLKCSVTGLQQLDLGSNELDDESIGVLVPVLKNYSHLESLRLTDNDSITSKGWQHLATILENPNSNLKELNLYGRSNFDDKALTVFARSLINNRSLHTLNLNDNQAITDEGWKVLSKSLCDTSSVNSTFLSNHTLRFSGRLNGVPSLQPLFTLNKIKDKKEVAIIKILQNHNDFDMTPFFEWEFKVLPLMTGWFERASVIDMPKDYEPNIEPRKLSSIYQFIRGMPLLYVETYLTKELEDIKAARKQKEEELVVLEERQKSIMKRLGQQRGAPA